MEVCISLHSARMFLQSNFDVMGLYLIPSQVRGSSTMESSRLSITTHSNPLEHFLLSLVDTSDEGWDVPFPVLVMQTLVITLKCCTNTAACMIQQIRPPPALQFCLTTFVVVPFTRTLCAIVVWNEGSEVEGTESPQSCSHLCVFGVFLYKIKQRKWLRILQTPIFSYALHSVPFEHNYSHPAPAS